MEIQVSKEVSTDSDPTPLQSLFVAFAVSRDLEAEAETGSGSGGSGPFSVEAEARKTYRFCFHIGYLT